MENTTISIATSSAPPEITTISSSSSVTSVTYYQVCWMVADSLEQVELFQYLLCFVNPAVSVLGFGFNMMSLSILARSGLHKPPNVLLFGLVIADSMCLMMSMDFALIILYYGPDKPQPAMCGFQYSDGVNMFLSISNLLFNFFGYWGRYVNTLIPVIITLERLLAVFRPMAFKSIVSARRAAYAVVFSFLFWLPWTLFISSTYDILQRPIYGGKGGDAIAMWMIVVLAKWYTRVVNIVDVVEFYFIDTFVSWMPLSLVIIGCSAIFIKIKIALAKRRRMTNSGKLAWSPRTTRTMMCTCIVFALTHVSTSVLLYAFPLEGKVAVRVRNLFVHLLYSVNSSSNLFLYIASNRNLLAIFLKIMKREK